MRTTIKYILTITLMLIFVTTGLFLPEWITAYTDQNIIGKVGFESVEMSKIILGNDTLMIRKMSLLRDYPQNVDRVSLETGMNFDLTSASDKFFEEVSELTKLGLLPEINSENKTTLKIDVSLYVRKDEQTISGVFWNIALQDGEFSGNFYMDDHTGKIMQFIITEPDTPLIMEKETIEAWADYLGLEAERIESQPEAYSSWENETTKVSENGYEVYNFELRFEDYVLSYTSYTFENGYGFGYIKKFISNHNISIKISL